MHGSGSAASSRNACASRSMPVPGTPSFTTTSSPEALPGIVGEQRESLTVGLAGHHRTQHPDSVDAWRELDVDVRRGSP